MYKIIPNKTSLLQFENETKNTLFLWKNRHFLKKDFYEFEDIYEHEGETVTVRLYLCSSDYSVATVSVVHG